jgi:hypothetical protein
MRMTFRKPGSAQPTMLDYGEEVREGEKVPEFDPVPLVAPAEPVEAPEQEPVGV